MKRAASTSDRYLTTVLFTDIVDSTRLATELGDRGWRDLIEQHHELIRRELRRFGGREIDTAGDGFFAAFDAPARAVGCALTIASVMPELGLHIRAGVHSGEVEEAGGKLRGIAVHIGARVGASAVADEVLTSATVRDLVAGSGIDFEDRGVRELKGVSGEWHLYAAREGALFRSEFPSAAGAAGREVAAVRHDVRGRARRRRLTIIGAGVAMLAAAGAGAFLITRPPPSLASVRPNAAGLIDAASGRILAEVNTGNRPDAIAFGEGALWVANTGDDTVSRIDPDTRAVVQTIEVGNGPSGLATGFGSVWVANSGERTVSRINAASNRVVQSITVGNGATAVATGAGAVWVTNAIDGSLSRIDPAMGTVTGVYPVGASPGGIAATDAAVWIADSSVGAVIRVDPLSGRTVASIGVGNGARAIAIANGDVWVANTLDGTVSRIDPKANRVTATIEVGEGPSGIVGSADSVWVASSVDGAVYHINPVTNVPNRIPVGSSPQALAEANGQLWFSARASTASHRGGHLRVLGSTDFDSIDPAIAFDFESNTLLSLTNDGLVAFQRTGGLAGATLVPDLSTSLPRPTDGGTTYTFQLRPGIVYADGQPVRASDFRRAIERQWTAPSDAQFAYPIGAPVYSGIVGATECGRHRSTCDLSKGIVTDDKAGTVTFHLLEPNADFLQGLALSFAFAVPASVPSSDVGNRPIPATGPYMIASYTPREVRLVRNPRFHEWSRLARPDGYPNEIVWSNGHSPDEELDMVVAGTADVMLGASPNRPSPDKFAQVRTQYPAQVHPWVSGSTYLHMNTSLPPFDDVNVRRAVNLAVDRGKLVELRGGSPQAQTTCQVILPNTQGYRPYCPYTLDPNPGGTWTAPDLAKARQLVAASGKAGTPVTVSAVPTVLPLGEQVIAVLDEIGFKATLRKVTLDELFDPEQGPKIQSSLVNWFPDNTVAGSLFGFFTCNDPNNLSHFCDPGFDAQIKKAHEIQQTDVAAAGDAWAKADRMLVDEAPIAALVNQLENDFVSARVGNYQHHPQWAILLDQLWVQ